jgi:prepilin-type N-terminal cleavage/methylation domain-containing protein
MMAEHHGSAGMMAEHHGSAGMMAEHHGSAGMMAEHHGSAGMMEGHFVSRVADFGFKGKERTTPSHSLRATGSGFFRFSIRNPKSPIRNHHAFTLLEILVVMILMALVAGFVMVYFAGNMGKSHVAGTARDLSSAIRQGRALAVERGEEQILLLDLDTRTFGIEGKGVRTIPPDITLTIADPLQGETGRGKHAFHLLPSGGVQGGAVTLSKGQSVINVFPDPVVGVRGGK